MSIDRRKIIGLFAASAATTLAGCGGGGDGGPYLQRVWVMNVNPEFPSANVSVGSTLVGTGVPFPGLTSPVDFDTGYYTVRVQRPAGGAFFDFDNVLIDARSSLPSLLVFYRHFAGDARLGSAPRGIESYFDSTVNIDYDLFDGDGTGNSFVQTQVLPFEGGGRQTSNSSTCRLRLYAEGSSTLIYDSGVQNRRDSILIHPRFPASSARSGEVAVTALNYGFVNASAVVWPNLLDSGLSLPAVSGTPDPRVRGVRGI
jgi:hypothetical protein